jgi:Flp pilus assembly protein protease CpaA
MIGPGSLFFYGSLRQALAIVFGIPIAWQDAIKGEVENYLIYAFAFLGLFINFATGTVIQSVIAGSIAFLVGVWMWKNGFWGGADTKYFAALAFTIPSPIVLVVTLILAYYLVLVTVYYYKFRNIDPYGGIEFIPFMFLGNCVAMLTLSGAFVNI